LKEDLGRSPFLSQVVEIIPCINEYKHTLANFKKWMKDECVPTPLSLSPATSKIVWEPLGVALIISAWNYPLMGIFQPLA